MRAIHIAAGKFFAGTDHVVRFDGSATSISFLRWVMVNPDLKVWCQA